MSSSSTLASRLKFIGLVLVGIAIFALVLVLMGTRLDNQDVTPSPASSAEQTRQEFAVTAAQIESSARTLGHTDLANDAGQWGSELGGVWVPWPDGAPEGHTNPPLQTVPVATDAELATSLTDWAERLTASDTPDPAVTSSIAMQAMAWGASLVDSPTCTDPDLGVVGQAVSDGVSIERLETARQWLEQSAAQLTPGERDPELARIATLTDIIEVALESGAPDTRPAMSAAPESDPVTAAYELIYEQLYVVADRSSADARAELLNYTCTLAVAPDAPSPGTLPGLGESSPSAG